MRKRLSSQSKQTRSGRNDGVIRQGQAALEYIITYGWGFIVILVVLGALAYFGFLNPSRYVPARCSFGVQLECADYRLLAASSNDESLRNNADNGNVTIILRNNFGENIRVTKLQTLNGASSATPNLLIAKGMTNITSIELDATDEMLLVQGERMTVPLIITFRRDTMGNVWDNITGDIFATVQRRD
ncbi:TPA: hypothetical protein HA251_04550 [Candidatus Woesearchaeota archaeon]|nr:hypothetical protein [Candidatus Woesearchaeota archaeon]